MIEQVQDELLEIRPGRQLFVRHWILGNNNNNNNNSSRTINLVCVHGTAGSQEQYLLFFKALDELLDNNNNNSKLCIHAWAYDAVGCGQSPKLDAASAYSDEQQVADLSALLQNHVSSQHDTFFVGHSYGPTWIYKHLLSSAQEQQQHTNNNNTIAGLVLIGSGLQCSELVVGGPKLFRYTPLWLLNCLQPMLTSTFLKIGFSPKTHQEQPELIAQAKLANNQNDMQTCMYYYRAHDWLPKLDFTLIKVGRILVLHGIDDQVIPIPCGQALANECKTPLISIPNASHMVLLEQPRVVAEHVLGFLSLS